MRVAWAVGRTVRGSLSRPWVGVMMVRTTRMFFGRIVMTTIWVIGPFRIISRISAGSPRVRGVSSIGVSFWMSVVVVVDVRFPGSRGCGRRCRRSRLW